MTQQDDMKKWIDNASYEELLGKWRRAPSGDPFFIGEIGDYFQEAMRRKGDEAGNAERVQASKRIGW